MASYGIRTCLWWSQWTGDVNRDPTGLPESWNTYMCSSFDGRDSMAGIQWQAQWQVNWDVRGLAGRMGFDRIMDKYSPKPRCVEILTHNGGLFPSSGSGLCIVCWILFCRMETSPSAFRDLVDVSVTNLYNDILSAPSMWIPVRLAARVSTQIQRVHAFQDESWPTFSL